MSKKYTLLILFLFLSSFVSAVIIEPNDTTIPNTDNPTTDLQLQLIQKIATLENKISQLSTKDDLSASTEFIAVNVINEIRDKVNFSILAIGLLTIFIVIIAYAVYLILIGNRRIKHDSRKSDFIGDNHAR